MKINIRIWIEGLTIITLGALIFTLAAGLIVFSLFVGICLGSLAMFIYGIYFILRYGFKTDTK